MARNRPSRRGGSGNRGTLELRLLADQATILGADGRPRDRKNDDDAPDTDAGERWAPKGARLLAEAPRFLDLSTNLYNRGLREGWLGAERGEIVLDSEYAGKARKVRYAIIDTPGKKPDADEPAGYRVDHFYTLELASSGRKAGEPRRVVHAADFVFNIAKGRISTYGALGAASDAIIIGLLKATGIEADDTLNNYDDLAALLAAANDEADATNYARKSLTSATVAVDDTANRVDIDVADQTWTALGGAANNTISDAFSAYDDDTGAGTDANIVPVSIHDFSLTTDGSDVTLQVATAGLLRAA